MFKQNKFLLYCLNVVLAKHNSKIPSFVFIRNKYEIDKSEKKI